jgi:hypothetical protein
MRIRRRLPIVLGFLLIAAAIAFAVFLRKHAPPEPARLLPGADGFFYADLQWVRRINISGNMPEVSHAPEYQQFIEATGFQFERDLNEAAFAIHYPVAGTNTKSLPEPRFSEVLVGKFDGQRFRSYLKKVASAVESYNSIDIYSIPIEDRTLRVAMLGVGTVAASNHPDPYVIRGMVDRSRKLASPFGGPALLRQFYKHVPLGSIVWTIFKVDSSGSMDSFAPSGISLLFQKPAVIVASGRYLGAVHLRAEAFAGSEEAAQQITEKSSTFLSLFQAAEISAGVQGGDPDVKQFFSSVKVEQHKDKAVLTASVPPGFLKKVFTEPSQEGAIQPAPVEVPTADAGAKSRPKRKQHKP